MSDTAHIDEKRLPHSGDQKTSTYGYCPECGAKGATRERRLNGDDICRKGHRYKSSDAQTSTRDIAEGLMVFKEIAKLSPSRQHKIAENVAANLGMTLIGHDPYAENKVDKTSLGYLQGFHDGSKSKKEAAAPSLLEALERITNEAVMDGLEDKPGWDCWIINARTAIEEARGKS